MFTPVLSKYKCNPYYIPDWLIIALGDFRNLGAMNDGSDVSNAIP